MSQLDLKIGPKIKSFRRQLGLQANKLAEDLGISPSYLNLIESGKRKIDGDLLLLVCEKLNINLGDNLVSSHGLRETGQSHDEGTFKVVGLLKPSNSVIDQLIITSPESVWDIHDTHNHEDDHKHEHEDDHENEYDDREITAMLIKFKSPMNIIQFPRQINENTNLQAAVPSYEISRLFKLFGFGIETLSYLAYLIILVSGFSLFINLFNSMRERKYEMALIRTLGASRFQLSSMIALESLVLTISGFVLGILFSRFGVMFVSSLMEESINYNFSSFKILNEEYWLLGLSILIGIISSLIPAIQVYKMNISKILADA